MFPKIFPLVFISKFDFQFFVSDKWEAHVIEVSDECLLIFTTPPHHEITFTLNVGWCDKTFDFQSCNPKFDTSDHKMLENEIKCRKCEWRPSS